MPRREDLDGAETRWVKRGGPTKADLVVVDLGDGPLVVKDFAAKAWWVRQIGRLQIGRECRAYRWLGPMPGLAPFVGRIDAHALALEWIDGELLCRAPRGPGDGARLLADLRAIVERMHRCGLVHLDLRGRENVMLDRSGGIHILDLAGALWFRPGGLAHRLLGRRLEATDEAAMLKWKLLLDAGPYTERERAFLDRYRLWRRLWIFNPKRRHRPGSSR